MIAVLVLVACGAADIDTEADGDAESEPVDSEAPGLEDVDEDGYASDVDCNDFDPAVHPGATESWNSVDDDCDGRSDGNGAYAGDAYLEATAVVEGELIETDLHCEADLQRTYSSFSFLVTCPSNPDDESALMLFGELFWVEDQENVASAGTWSGAVRGESSEGWQTEGTGTLYWPSFELVTLTFAFDTVSLDSTGSGTLAFVAGSG